MRNRSNAGFSLAAVIFFVTAASIALAAVPPAYQLQAKREREIELIFRGEEYMRAIQKYRAKFGIFPPTIDALLQTNGLRFLRRKYTDPVTDKEFRLITLNPDFTLNGSVLTSPANSPPSGLSGLSPAGTIQTGSQPVTGAAALPGVTQPGRTSVQSGPNAGQTFGGGGIVGVASNSEEEAIKVYNQRAKYNEWEFIALAQPGQNAAPVNPRDGSGGNQLPGTGTNPNSGPGGPSVNPGFPNNTIQTQPNSGPGGFFPGGAGSLGGIPAERGGSGQQMQQPFGFGAPPQPVRRQ